MPVAFHRRRSIPYHCRRCGKLGLAASSTRQYCDECAEKNRNEYSKKKKLSLPDACARV